jgi:hypothetical protein
MSDMSDSESNLQTAPPAAGAPGEAAGTEPREESARTALPSAAAAESGDSPVSPDKPPCGATGCSREGRNPPAAPRISECARNARRANAQKSTGPRTEEGKQRAS